ncbi:MAG TPA: hypothetical protein VJC21_01520 [Candidatus Nanoarchaeia archaeon]|nr:hypothetical protein [Candidatus Nanoarchaeia archaeon]
MSLFDKFKFWKKEDEFDKMAEKELRTESAFPRDDLGLHEKSPFGEEPSAFGTPEMAVPPSLAPAPGAAGSGEHDRELELINSKLDTIKALISALDQRLASLERSLSKEEKPRLW